MIAVPNEATQRQLIILSSGCPPKARFSNGDNSLGEAPKWVFDEGGKETAHVLCISAPKCRFHRGVHYANHDVASPHRVFNVPVGSAYDGTHLAQCPALQGDELTTR